MAKIDLTKLGLTNDSTLEEIQNKLNEQTLFTQEELDAEKNTAASGARKAAEEKFNKSKNILSAEELEEYNKYKNQKKLDFINDNDIIKKINDDDKELIINNYKLLDLDGEEFDNAIKEIEDKESKRFKNDVPDAIEEENSESIDDSPFDVDDF